MDNTDIEKTINSLPSTKINGNYSVCPQCGREVSAEFSYCNFCGYYPVDEYTAPESENNEQTLNSYPEYAQYEKYNGDFDNISYTHETYNALADTPYKTTDEDVSDYKNELSEIADYNTEIDEGEDDETNYDKPLWGNLFMCIFITVIVLPIICTIINFILRTIGG